MHIRQWDIDRFQDLLGDHVTPRQRWQNRGYVVLYCFLEGLEFCRLDVRYIVFNDECSYAFKM